ncbi:hypothetical protein HN51_065070 [Arachis hypogaea]|uniref:uncharacterized protein LOC107637544 n=1 Tax=Arachis ipaensis TaxID=130454 RepID=UPI0007AFC736|nr:uncharacterized protein LOC107637544 [Arachis ipaensis]XP_025644811.1 uncharacterized protein LOC112740245 [Arachis hypogaea]QHO06170.1 uncharacterized protein DS421_14g452430 [Arachis hypogaea]
MAPLLSFTGPMKCREIISFSHTYNSSCHVSIARNLSRNVLVNRRNSVSLVSYNSLMHRNLCCDERQRGSMSLIAYDANNKNYSESESQGNNNEAMDAVMKLYSAFKNKDTQDLADILADECRCVCNFLSFFQAFHGKTQVMEFFGYLIKILGNHIQIVVKPTLHDGMNVGVHWKFEWKKIHVPLGNGFSFHICQTYHGKAVIKNIEMFMEPLLHLEPYRLIITSRLTQLAEKIALFTAEKSGNKKAKKVLLIVLALLSVTASFLFMKLATS